MRVAFVYHLPNPGGVTRFTHALIEGLLAADECLTIDYYLSDRLVSQGRVASFADRARVRVIGISDPEVIDSNLDDPEVAATPGPKLVRWASERLSGHPQAHEIVRAAYLATRSVLDRVTGRRRGKRWFETALTPTVVSALRNYDLVYLPFPYYLQPAALAVPVVATFHDLNHLYFPENFGRSLMRQMDRQLRFWTRRADAAVTSTRYIEGDLLRHYPDADGRTSVVYVAPYSIAPLTEEARAAALRRFGLADRGYWIYPSNHSHHKNLLGLVRAADLVKRRAGRLAFPVVFTGFGTDGIGTGKWPSFHDIDTFLSTSGLVVGEDVRGLGFVTDEEVDALTRSAGLVVSTSLYEAGCGPALDAWQFGVPVAFSNIPPFVEQLQALGVQARVFDPRDPSDIAAVLEQATTEREASAAMAEASRQAIRTYTWESAARGYLEAFRRAIDAHANPGSRAVERGSLRALLQRSSTTGADRSRG